ncbi:DUF2617 family protein [Spirillospora sp. NPDC029432]|uniref:DUF2617 family protein n=1 Tax=Spirillospora sp. NPDC029432 TaxID=3154599 RepID=UPI0034514B3E
MLAPLDTPYADTRADALSFALGLPPMDALAVLPVRNGGLALELRLLGASHQVIVEPGFSETVACLPGDPEPLPGRLHADHAGWAYDFTATTAAHGDGAAFEHAVDELLARLDGRADALTGTFPGSPHAVTALALTTDPSRPGRTGWHTWHAYPQTREIVMTRSRLVRTL